MDGINFAMSNRKKLKGAVIGYGFISGKGHIPAYLDRAKTKEDVEIIAVADICKERRELAQKTLPGARIYHHATELLDNEATNLDFVDISTPPCYHARITHEALDRNLHVLCEKPLATSTQSAREMLEHAKRAKRVLFPCHNYKHAPVVKAINEVIESGKLGTIRSVTLNTFRNTHAKGVPGGRTDGRRENIFSGGGESPWIMEAIAFT